MTPIVSIIVPCFNEEHTIGMLLDAILQQTFPNEDLEVIICDGLSTDGTRANVQQFAQAHPNLDIRLDAHSIPYPDYVERCFRTLEETEAANVGGIWEIKPATGSWMARSIAIAAAHPLGAGDARYRYGGAAGETDTVPFGAFQKTWLDRIGRFDETLITNEDYEYNYRIRNAGGKIWYDPSIRSIYFARGDLHSLASQYLRYGFWKAVMIKRNPASLRWRQALPVLFVLGVITLGILSIWFPICRYLLVIYLGAYALISVIVGCMEAIRHRDPGMVLGFPMALWTMHISWGSAFLWGILTRSNGRRRG
jgi:succinoglycan biosynthesis protein ExoA